MIEVINVIRKNKQAIEVIIGIGAVEIQYILDQHGKLFEAGKRRLDCQIMDDQTLIISPADLRRAKKRAGAILREKGPTEINFGPFCIFVRLYYKIEVQALIAQLDRASASGAEDGCSSQPEGTIIKIQ